MTTSRMWREELSRIWPAKPSTGWDHYLRQQPETSQKRECIYPEIPRTKHISSAGTNVNTREQVQKFAMYNFADDVSDEKRSLLGNPFQPTKYLQHLTYHKWMERTLRESSVLSSLGSNLGALSRTSTKSNYVFYYKREEFDRVSRQVSLPKTQPRGWHRGVLQTRIPNSPSLLFLIDRRSSIFGDSNQLLRISPDVKKVGAKRGESCDSACRRNNGKRCLESSLEFLNRCDALKEIFLCESGCGHQVGAEIPCYVDDPSQPTHHQCLVSDGGGAIRCSPSHKSTRRLCGCV